MKIKALLILALFRRVTRPLTINLAGIASRYEGIYVVSVDVSINLENSNLIS